MVPGRVVHFRLTVGGENPSSDFCVRISGGQLAALRKRELVQLNPFDLIVLLTLSNTVQNGIIGDDNSVNGGIIGATSLLVMNYLVVRFLYGHKKLDQIMESRADVLVDNGEIRLERLKKELIRPPQLEAAARKQGFESLT